MTDKLHEAMRDAVEHTTCLDWHEQRFTDFIPSHFVGVKMTKHHEGNRPELLAWLEVATKGRFSIGEIQDDNADGKAMWAVRRTQMIAFEDPAEATLYSLKFL